MKDTIRSMLAEMMHPPVQPRRKRIFGFLVIGVPFFFILLYEIGLPLWLIIALTLLYTAVISAALRFMIIVMLISSSALRIKTSWI